MALWSEMFSFLFSYLVHVERVWFDHAHRLSRASSRLQQRTKELVSQSHDEKEGANGTIGGIGIVVTVQSPVEKKIKMQNWKARKPFLWHDAIWTKNKTIFKFKSCSPRRLHLLGARPSREVDLVPGDDLVDGTESSQSQESQVVLHEQQQVQQVLPRKVTGQQKALVEKTGTQEVELTRQVVEIVRKILENIEKKKKFSVKSHHAN